MRVLRVVAIVASLAPGVAGAQLAVTRPTEKLLMLPLPVTGGVDSLTSVQVMDAARDKVSSLARYKVTVIPKAKICEALQASGFPCDILMDEQQVRQLARFLTVDAFTVGTLAKTGSALTATVRVVDVGGSGFGFLFSVNHGNPASAAALGEAIATRLNSIIRAGEQARECRDQRERGAFARALESARKATQTEPNLPAAHLCTLLVYEAQRMPPDSIIAAARRALRGDSLSATAWERIAQAANVKGDTALMIDARTHQLRGEPQNTPLRLGLVQLLFQMKRYQDAVNILDEGLAKNPGDEALLARKLQVCLEGSLWRCALDGLLRQAQVDSTRWADTSFLKTAMGAAQQISDTLALLRVSREATRRYPNSDVFWNTRGAAFEQAGMPDSALVAYRRAYTLKPSDEGALRIAKAIIDGATYDTATAARCRGDSACVRSLRAKLADRLDTARVYLDRAAQSPDTTTRLNAAAIMLPAGEKLVRAGVPQKAYAWMDKVLQLVAPRSPADTNGIRQRIRVNASFWFGLSAVPALPGDFQAMSKTRNCGEAKQFNDQLTRVKEALTVGRSLHPPTADRYLTNLQAFDRAMQQVKQAYKCRNF